MLGTLVATAVLAAAPHAHHRPGCNSSRCDRWADATYARHEARKRRRIEAREPWATATASYYDDAGATASGAHAALGFAHLGPGEGPWPGMAFGTRVEFCAARCAVGTMDDHGPYVFSREFDLDEALKDAIGASDLGLVRWRVVG